MQCSLVVGDCTVWLPSAAIWRTVAETWWPHRGAFQRQWQLVDGWAGWRTAGLLPYQLRRSTCASVFVVLLKQSYLPFAQNGCFGRWCSVVVTSFSVSTKLFCVRPSYYWDGWPSSAGIPPQYVAPGPTQPPTLSRTVNEYWPMCTDALWLKNRDDRGNGISTGNGNPTGMEIRLQLQNRNGKEWEWRPRGRPKKTFKEVVREDCQAQQQQQWPFNGLWSGTTRVGRYQKKHSPTHTHLDHRASFITFLHLQWSMASSLFNLRAWQSSLCLEPSISCSIHFFTQSSSSFRNTWPYQRSLFCCNTNAMSSTPSLSLTWESIF